MTLIRSADRSRRREASASSQARTHRASMLLPVGLTLHLPTFRSSAAGGLRDSFANGEARRPDPKNDRDLTIVVAVAAAIASVVEFNFG